MPVSSFQFKPLGEDSFGEITKKLLNKWSINVGIDIQKQIIEFNKEHALEVKGSTPYKHKAVK